MSVLCFLDTETDGVHPGRKAWEVAIIRRDIDENGRTAQRRVSMFLDIDLSTADPFGLKVGGFYDRHPMGRYLSLQSDRNPDESPVLLGIAPRRQAAHEIARLTHGAHIVGAVPNFDTEVLAGLLRSQGLAPAWHYHLVDVENLAVGYLSHERHMPPPWSSDELTDLLGLEPVPEQLRHTAMGDAVWAMDVYDRVMGGAS